MNEWKTPVKSTESLVYFLERMANDITHLKTDNQLWYDKTQKLEQLTQQPEREREKEFDTCNYNIVNIKQIVAKTECHLNKNCEYLQCHI